MGQGVPRSTGEISVPFTKLLSFTANLNCARKSKLFFKLNYRQFLSTHLPNYNELFLR